MPSKNSLINPDFNGLYTTAHLGNKQYWWSNIIGSCIVMLLVYSWVLGFLLPIIAVILYIGGYSITAITIITIIIVPYVIPVNASKRICQISNS